jgi:hypothetical protein
MTQKEKIGIGVLVGLFVVLGLILVFTLTPIGNKDGSAEDSYFVQKRVQTLQQSDR